MTGTEWGKESSHLPEPWVYLCCLGMNQSRLWTWTSKIGKSSDKTVLVTKNNRKSLELQWKVLGVRKVFGLCTQWIKNIKLLNVYTLAIIWMRDWAVNQAYHANNSSKVLVLTSEILSWKSPPHREPFLGPLRMKGKPLVPSHWSTGFYHTGHIIRFLEKTWPAGYLSSKL